MKTQLTVVALVAMIISVSWTRIDDNSLPKKQTVKAKTANPNFAFFRTHRQGKGVTSSWGLDQNAGVNGFVLQRTYEDPNDPYSEWSNICGMNCDNNRSFKHEDENVSPGMISYRVIGYMNNGDTFTSPISTERVVSH